MMTYFKPDLKMLAILLAVLTFLFAFTGVAQAEPNAFWLVNGAKFSSGLLPTLNAEAETHFTLLTELGGKQIHLLCGKVSLIGAHLVEPLAQVLGKAQFDECEFLELVTPGGTVKKVGACTPVTGGVSGRLITNSVIGLIKKHTNNGTTEPVIQFQPAAGTIFATINMGEECGYGENILIEGVWYFKDCLLEALVDKVTHLIEELGVKESSARLSALKINGGTKVGIVDGSAFVRLGGLHAGMTFAAHAAP